MKIVRLIFVFAIVLFSGSISSRALAQGTEVVLKETAGWSTDTIAQGFIRYTYQTYNRQQSAFQIVNVLEIDYTNPRYNIEVKYVSPSDSLSNVARNAGAIAGINGSYELDATFIRTNGKLNSQVTLPSGHLRYWKHEGAFFYDGSAKIADIQFGNNNSYFASSFPNVLSGAPMLIDNFNPVGETFIGDVTGINLNALDFEDYRRHQGVRHPRTAVALTEGNKLLLIVVDGRRANISEGMSAKELTQFLVRYFNPKSALNTDGGGSSTMYIKGSNESVTDVVNYPTDNNKFDHYGQRSVRTFILVKKIEGDGIFERGSGTVADPYIINNAEQLNNIRKTNWNSAINNKPYFRLENDIDLNGMNWIPINNSEPYAQLHFDGNGHVIKNMSVKGVPYASLFGVLCGSCKNLGVINSEVESSNGGGIIAGYVGIKTPTSSSYTGVIENCFTTGVVSGTDGVGGIVGNIGKQDVSSGIASVVKNCYSTATVIAKNTANNSRAGGIAGIVFDKGVLENSYATGTVVSSLYGAGGVVGWTDTSVKGLVAMNDSVINKNSGNIGRIAAFMGEVGGIQTQGINCWGYEGLVLNNSGTLLSRNEMNEATVTVRNAPYDGLSKNLAYVSNSMNYFLELEWDFASENNIWAQTMSNGKPIFQWLFNRGDYATIDGHGGITSTKPVKFTPEISYSVSGDGVKLQSKDRMSSVSAYNSMGKEIIRTSNPGHEIFLHIYNPGIYIIRVSMDNQTVSRKLLVQ